MNTPGHLFICNFELLNFWSCVSLAASNEKSKLLGFYYNGVLLIVINMFS